MASARLSANRPRGRVIQSICKKANHHVFNYMYYSFSNDLKYTVFNTILYPEQILYFY